MLYKSDNDAANPPEGGLTEAGGLLAASLSLSIDCLARMPDSPQKSHCTTLRVPLDSIWGFFVSYIWWKRIKGKNDQINKYKIHVTSQSNVCKCNVHINNNFYKHIWKQTYLTRGTFNLSFFIPCLVTKAAHSTRGDSGTLANKTVASPLVSGWWGQGIIHVFTHYIKYNKKN